MSAAAPHPVNVITAQVVLTMTWLVAPLLTRWLKPFLYPPARVTT